MIRVPSLAGRHPLAFGRSVATKGQNSGGITRRRQGAVRIRLEKRCRERDRRVPAPFFQPWLMHRRAAAPSILMSTPGGKSGPYWSLDGLLVGSRMSIRRLCVRILKLLARLAVDVRAAQHRCSARCASQWNRAVNVGAGVPGRVHDVLGRPVEDSWSTPPSEFADAVACWPPRFPPLLLRHELRFLGKYTVVAGRQRVKGSPASSHLFPASGGREPPVLATTGGSRPPLARR